MGLFENLMLCVVFFITGGILIVNYQETSNMENKSTVTEILSCQRSTGCVVKLDDGSVFQSNRNSIKVGQKISTNR